MPPFATNMVSPSPPPTGKSSSATAAAANIITLNVGGQLFQTTLQTLAGAGESSLLSALSASSGVPFVDRDPDLFSVLLSFLRSGRLPSKAAAFDLDDIAAEAEFYGLDPTFLDSSRFDAFDLHRTQILPLNGRDAPSAVTVAPAGSVHVAHGSKITSFDPSLRRKTTVLTPFPAVDSLLAISPSTVAAGATDFPGLRVIDIGNSHSHSHSHSNSTVLNWTSYAASGGNSTVQAIGSSPNYLFGSFESSRRNSNAIVAFDLAGGTLLPVTEFGRGEIYGADLDSAIPATKLRWLPNMGLLMAAGTHGGPSGLVGNVRLWDVRSATAVWEVTDRTDCFSDATASEALSAVFKVGVNSGNVFMADLRRAEKKTSPWVCLGRAVAAENGKRKEGSGCRMESYGDQVFCSRGGDVEMWSEVVMGSSGGGEDGLAGGGRVMRRNVLGRAADGGRSKIERIGFGGGRMVMIRKDQHCVEVWENPGRR